jgi:hypothetical protein
MTGTMVPNAEGTALVPYNGPDLTAGNEIDKLASNVAMGRITCGVHWRSDSLQGMLLGEHCAIAVLQDMRGRGTSPSTASASRSSTARP